MAIVIDQDALRDGVFAPFFDRLASTTPTLARLALRTGAAVIPTFCVPSADGGHRNTYEAPVEVERSGNLERDTVLLTAECTALIERWVRAYPEHLSWMHPRILYVRIKPLCGSKIRSRKVKSNVKYQQLSANFVNPEGTARQMSAISKMMSE